MKEVYFVGGAEVAVLLAKSLAQYQATAVFVANGLKCEFLQQHGRCIGLEDLSCELQKSPDCALLVLNAEVNASLLHAWAAIASKRNIAMMPDNASLQCLQQPQQLMHGLGLPATGYLTAKQVEEKAQTLSYPLLLQGPVLDPNNFFHIVRKPKQLGWALDNAKALAITNLRLRPYQEVQTRFMLQASFYQGQLCQPEVVGVNCEHGVLHEAWQGEAVPDHLLIKAQAILARLALLVVKKGVITANFDVVKHEVQLQNFTLWPTLAGWVGHKTPCNVFAQQLHFLLCGSLLPVRPEASKPASAIKLQPRCKPVSSEPLLHVNFGETLLFYQQGNDVREVTREVIIAANKHCQ